MASHWLFVMLGLLLSPCTCISATRMDVSAPSPGGSTFPNRFLCFLLLRTYRMQIRRQPGLSLDVSRYASLLVTGSLLVKHHTHLIHNSCRHQQ
jgi:hypothetical protein